MFDQILLFNYFQGFFVIQQLTQIRMKEKYSKYQYTHRRGSANDNSFHLFSKNDRTKCFDYFNSFKKTGSTTLKKEEIKKLLEGIGVEISQQILQKMLLEGDCTGKEEMNYESFQKIIMNYKNVEEACSNQQAKNAFEYLLDIERISQNDPAINYISLSTLLNVIQSNFDISINFNLLYESIQSKSHLSYEDFKDIIMKK